MKKTLFITLLICIFVFAAAGQKLLKPTRIPTPATAAQEKLIQEGTKFHDAKNYDAAIAKYAEVLAENPDCVTAIYETSLSYYNKGDKVKAMETAYRGSAYISDELSLLYGMMANCMDDVGKPDEAIKIYREAEDILAYYPDRKKALASINYNLGITYFRQKKYLDARTELKKAVEADPAYASPHYVLAVIYNGTKYPVPAFLAAARFLSLELGSERARNAAKVIGDILKPAPKDPKTGGGQYFCKYGRT